MSATNRGAERKPKDAYPTPAWCTEALMSELVIPPNSSVLEPCVGTEAIWKVLKWHFDENMMDWCEIERGKDFLTSEMAGRMDFVITNPPFSLAQEFVTKALEIANCVIMLLPLPFLASRKRKEWWQTRKPTSLFILSQRPSFTGKGTDATDYAWFVWDSTGRQKVGWHWI